MIGLVDLQLLFLTLIGALISFISFHVNAGGVFGLALFAFSAIHYIMIFSNKTTIEAYEQNRYAATAGTRLHGDDYVNIFDLGTYRENWV